MPRKSYKWNPKYDELVDEELSDIDDEPIRKKK